MVVLLFGLLRGSWLQAMLGGIALGMSLLPEEFPLVMTVFMAMGAWRISQARVLTRRASAIETLGATTVLCTDKTGTLTENRMTVVTLRGDDGRWDKDSKEPPSPAMRDVLDVALSASAKEPSDPMDLAVHAMATSIAVLQLPGHADRKAHSCLWSSPGPIRGCQCHSAMRRSKALVRTQRAHWRRSANFAICRMIGWYPCALKWMNWPIGESGCSRSPDRRSSTQNRSLRCRIPRVALISSTLD